MSHDAINSWVSKAKGHVETLSGDDKSGVQVVRRPVVASKGNIIMDMAEKLRPWLTTVFAGLRDENGMLFQPAHIRGIALNVAQDLVKQQEEENKNTH